MAAMEAAGRRDTPVLPGRGRGRGKGRKGDGRGSGSGAARNSGPDVARELAELDDRSIQHESNIEILRAKRAAIRRGRTAVQDTIRENEGVDEDDPLISVDDGIRLEPFNMRREMAEGHFDEGGFYILNKDEEKEVTDAWLDTVDQAARTATFQKVDRQQKAGEAAASRLAALSRNLGAAEEKEELEGISEAAAVNASINAAERPMQEATIETPDDSADDISMLEALISELMPLEKPAEALARLAKGRRNPRGASPLKMRCRIRRARAEVGTSQIVQSAHTACASDLTRPKQSKRKFSEFGYEDSVDATSTTREAAADSKHAEQLKRSEEAEDIVRSCKGAESSKVAGSTASAAFALDHRLGADGASPDLDKSVVVVAAVAAAAEKAAAKERAVAEAAAACAAEMKLTRQTLHMAVDGKSGPEAIAMITAEEPRVIRQSQVAAALPHGDLDAPHANQQQHKRAAAHGSIELERMKKIERLTDLCDRLLQRGVLVYDSTRELLAIEVRERKGEQLRKEKEDAPAEPLQSEEVPRDSSGITAIVDVPANGLAPNEHSNGTGLSSVGSGMYVMSGCITEDALGVEHLGVGSSVLFENRRYQAPEGQVVSKELDAELALPAGDQSLLWQYRWSTSPEQVHGPFDSVTMHGWVMQGCFAEERPAEVRQCNENNQPQEQCWHRWSKVNFALYL